MIGRLRGILAVKQPPAILLDVAGVGYEIEAPMSTFYELPELGREVTLHIHLSIKEDAHSLYGFAKESERRLFRTERLEPAAQCTVGFLVDCSGSMGGRARRAWRRAEPRRNRARRLPRAMAAMHGSRRLPMTCSSLELMSVNCPLSTSNR